MANIVISELRHAGSELSMDSESYLTDLNEQEMIDNKGGFISFSLKKKSIRLPIPRVKVEIK
jgi:hypothetical protein